MSRLAPPRGPRLTARRVATALLTALAAPPAAGDIDADIEQRIADVQAAQQLVTDAEQEIRRAMQQAEADEQALLNKLGQTHDALQHERARNAALEAELNRLRPGATAPADAATPPPGDPPLGPAAAPRPAYAWLPWPPRELNPLGLVRSQETDLGPAPAGADGLVIHLPAPAAAPDAVTPVRARVEAGRLVFERPGPSGDSVAIAELRIEGDRLRWVWRGFSPLHLRGALADLDRRLRAAIIEVRAGDAVLQQTQFEPPRFTFSSGPGAQDDPPFDFLLGGTSGRLVPGPAAPGWILHHPSGLTLVWVSRGQTVAATFEAVPAERCRMPVGGAPQPHLSVAVQRGPGLDQRLAELDRQLAQWQRDLQPSSGPGIDTKRARELVDRLTTERTELASLQPRLTAAAGSAAPAALASDINFTVAGGQPEAALYQFGFE